jgi:hypothetical protein
MTDEDKIASLEARIAASEARVAELEAKGKPPAPFDPGPYQRFDRTAGMSMAPSAVEAMVNAENGIMRGVLRDARAPTGPSSAGIVPSSQSLSNVRATGGGSGWAREVPLSNPPGTRMVDAIAIADDVRQRAEKKRGG